MPRNNSVLLVLPSAARTASGTATIDLRNVIDGELTLDVTAASGTLPTLDVSVAYTHPATGDSVTLMTYTQATGVTSESVDIPVTGPLPPQATVTWTIGGTATPTFTFAFGGLVTYER